MRNRIAPRVVGSFVRSCQSLVLDTDPGLLLLRALFRFRSTFRRFGSHAQSVLCTGQLAALSEGISPENGEQPRLLDTGLSKCVCRAHSAAAAGGSMASMAGDRSLAARAP